MSISSNVYSHAAYVLLAEFDIDQGSVLTHQYPYPMGIDEQFIAEMMIPDGVHDQKSDWTIFFLNQVAENTVTNSLIDDEPASSGEKQPLLYVLNLVRTVKNPNARRGANVKALALCTPHPYLHIFKPILTMALDDYFVQPDVQCLARLFDAVNAMDVSRAPVLSRDEMLIMRATERKDVFAEKFFGTELLADIIPKDARGPHDSISSTASMDTFDTDIVTGVRSRKSSFTSDSAHSHSPPTSLKIKNDGSNEDVAAKPNGDSHRTSLDRMSVASSVHLVNRGDNSSTGHGSVAPTTRKVINSRDSHFYTSFIRYYPRLKEGHLDLPVHCPLSTFPEEVGDFSLIKLINTFPSSNPVLGPITPHLHPQGAQTHPLVVLFNALVSQKRILFLGQRLPAGDVANFVLAACAFGAGCSVLRGFTERAFPFVGLFHTRVLEGLDSFIAGASNPVFETVPIWDVLCNINTGRITVRKDITIPPPPPPLPSTSHAPSIERIGQGIGASIPSTAGIGGTGAFPAPPAGLAPKSGTVRAEDDDSRGSKKADESESSDSMLMEDISAVIQNHAGELLVRARVADYVQRFVRVAARWECEVNKFTEIDHPSKQYGEGQLGSGVTFIDEALVAREMPANAWRINAWRKTSYYTSYRDDFKAHLENRHIKTIDINHLVSRLRYGRNMSDGEAEMIMRSLCAYVQTYEEVVELLALLPPHHGGLTPLCFGLFHPDVNIRDLTVDFITNLRSYPIGLQFLAGLNYFHRFGYVRLAQQRELGGKHANGSGDTNGLSRSPERIVAPVGFELPPEYQASSYNDTRPTLKAEQEMAVIHVNKMTQKLQSPSAADTSDHAIDELNGSLRELNLQIHDHPELRWDVKHAHDVLTQFVEEQGFQVTRHYLSDQLPGNTAWKAEFIFPNKSGQSVPVVGFNSEMDALPGIGHACGHNLIAIIGVAGAVGLKRAMEKHNIPGQIILLGTPAEEAGAGKVHLLNAGAYKQMDICLMAHPGPGDDRQVMNVATLALQTFTVEYHGQGAHAGAAPWEGKNALDAAFVAYAALSALRQQIHPSARVHGIIEGRDWASNIIPNYARMEYTVRAPTWGEVVALRARVNRCFEAAAHATSCTMAITELNGLKDVRGSEVLSNEFGAIMTGRYGYSFDSHATTGASTDFGNVTYELPSIHPGFTIPTVPNGGNHTPEYTAAARTQEAHERAVAVSKGLAALGLRTLLDEDFLRMVKDNFKNM
ncbi:unnamed protein product [Rhizoctonia solani]|uniref:UDENN domain-containing protein n=1 Tax=Rhizoctonia solani TaxID=456999 RepID=A0A8H3BYQ5_9AGAM|nr:unnamed protein product [Rhizoctonia solani]